MRGLAHISRPNQNRVYRADQFPLRPSPFPEGRNESGYCITSFHHALVSRCKSGRFAGLPLKLPLKTHVDSLVVAVQMLAKDDIEIHKLGMQITLVDA